MTQSTLSVPESILGMKWLKHNMYIECVLLWVRHGKRGSELWFLICRPFIADSRSRGGASEDEKVGHGPQMIDLSDASLCFSLYKRLFSRDNSRNDLYTAAWVAIVRLL